MECGGTEGIEMKGWGWEGVVVIYNTQMRNKVRKLQHETVGELTKAILAICGEQQYNFQEQLRQIVRSAVGVDDEKGVLSIRSEYYIANAPVNWVPEYLKLVDLLAPTNDFMRRVVASADSPVFLEVL